MAHKTHLNVPAQTSFVIDLLQVHVNVYATQHRALIAATHRSVIVLPRLSPMLPVQQ
jgi:hypothetical protein